MKHIGPGQPRTRAEVDARPPSLRALRACEARLRDLQNPPGSREASRDRQAQWQVEADSAVHMARRCATQGAFGQARPEDLASMATRFSHLRRPPAIQSIDAILALLAREVSRRASTGDLSRWHARQLAQIAHALTTGMGPCVQEGLTRMAQTILGLPQLGRDRGWEDWPLAMLVNDLGKGQGTEVLQARARLARHFCRLPQQRLVEDWPPRDLAMMAAGLGRGEGRDPAFEEGRALLAGVFMCRSQPVLERGWTARDLAILASGLGKGRGEAVEAALDRLAQIVRNENLTAASGWVPQSLAMMANGLGKGQGAGIQTALAQLACALPEAGQLTEQAGWSALPLSMITNGLSKGEGPDVQQALVRLACALPEAGRLTCRAGWSLYHLALMANGLAKGAGPAVLGALDRLSLAIQNRDLAAQGQECLPQHLAMMANGLSKGEGGRIRAGLTHLARAIRHRELTMQQGWSVQLLAMMTNGLGKGEGPDIQQALRRLAAVFIREPERAAEQGWAPRHLAMMASGLTRGEGACVQAARTRLAIAIEAPSMRAQPGWTACNLAVIANGLSRMDSGWHIRNALTGLAAKMNDPALLSDSDWSARHLAMMAYEIGRGEGQQVHKAQERMARMILGQELTTDGGWTVQNLAMMANGISRGRSALCQEALTRLAAVVREEELGSPALWTARHLAMMLEAVGLTQHRLPLFQALSAALAHRAGQEPEALITALANLGRHALSGPHLKAASQLLEALDTEGGPACSGRARHELLWITSLLHFASQQQKAADPHWADTFAGAYRHSLMSAVTSPETELEGRYGDRWHVRWSADYWRSLTRAPDRPVVLAARRESEVSAVQQQIFAHLREHLPGLDIRMESRINGFPVDILIEQRVCVEVDGPRHFVPRLAGSGQPGPDAGAGLRRTKDEFIDHMLRQYGYQVLRVAAMAGPEALRAFALRVRALVQDLAPGPGAVLAGLTTRSASLP